MSNNQQSSRFSNAGSSGSGSSGRKAPPPPKISGPTAAAGSEYLRGIPEQQVQGLFAVPNPPQALAPLVANSNSQTQERNENERSSSSSAGQSSSEDSFDAEEINRAIAIIQHQVKVGAGKTNNLQAKLKKAEEKLQINAREHEDLESRHQELCSPNCELYKKWATFEREKEELQATIQKKDQEIGALKRELEQERNGNDFIAQNIAKLHELCKRKKLN